MMLSPEHVCVCLVELYGRVNMSGRRNCWQDRCVINNHTTGRDRVGLDAVPLMVDRGRPAWHYRF